MLNSPTGRFRIISFAEGLSFLLLLGIAMPLKYLADMPMAVKVVGWAHGVLFILYVLSVVDAARACGWPPGRIALALLCSLLPVAPFWMERQVRAEERAAARS